MNLIQNSDKKIFFSDLNARIHLCKRRKEGIKEEIKKA